VIARLKSFLSPTLLAVIVPTLIAVVYYGLLAEDVYISEARIVVRHPSQGPRSPLDAALDQTGFGAANEGNNTVIAYLQSRAAIAEADRDGALKKAYSDPDLFWFDRFGLFGKSDEEFYRYFQDQLAVEEGATTQVLTIRVRAFTPQQAQSINARLVEQSEALVNSLAERSQADLIAIAEGEVEEAAQKARAAAIALAKYRNTSGIVDPVQESEVGLQMISKLQDELIAAQTRLRQLQTYTPDASQIPFLKTQVRDLQREIEEVRANLTGGNASLSSALTRYQELQVDVDFAEKQLAATRASLQEARAEARRKQAYLEKIAAPSLPDYPVEPRRIRSILAALVLGLLAWGVLTMLAIGVREHRD
jgi:ABC-2 type transport system permease protein/capsular polysaccharide transport system permease protein